MKTKYINFWDSGLEKEVLAMNSGLTNLERGRMEGKAEGKKEGIHEGIKGSVLLLRSLGHDNDVIRTAIISQYHLSDEEADQYL